MTGRLRDFAWKEDGVVPPPLVIDCDWAQFIGANLEQPKPPNCADTGGGKSGMTPESGPGK